MDASATVIIATQFDYRDIVKDAGARWDAKSKTWSLTLGQWMDLADTIDYGSRKYSSHTAKFWAAVKVSSDGKNFVEVF